MVDKLECGIIRWRGCCFVPNFQIYYPEVKYEVTFTRETNAKYAESIWQKEKKNKQVKK